MQSDTIMESVRFILMILLNCLCSLTTELHLNAQIFVSGLVYLLLILE